MRPFWNRLIGSRRTLRCALWVSVVAATGGNLLCEAQAPSTPQYGVKMRESWISMPDGVRLAADLYMPVGNRKGEVFPVILEYLPYRKTESRARNHALYSYFVARGYVVARVDIDRSAARSRRGRTNR